MINFKLTYLINFSIKTWILFCIVYFIFKTFTTGFTFTTPNKFYNVVHNQHKFNVFNSLIITFIETAIIATILYFFYIKMAGLALADSMFTLGQLLMSTGLKSMSFSIKRWFTKTYMF